MTIVIKVNEETKNKMIEYYKDKLRDKTPPYAVFQAQEEDTIITLYTSGKAMFQGLSADIDANMWQAIKADTKEEEIVDTKDYINVSSIGSDEVGTGDYFGPVVVTAAYVPKKNIKFLQELGVHDSKKIKDENILKMAPQIVKKIKYKTIILNNVDYNKNYSKDVNMNKIKAIMHNRALYNLLQEVKEKPEYVIVDQFAKEKKYYEYLNGAQNIVKNITFMTKAEDKNLAVACGSIISRYILIKEFDRLSDLYHTVIPKGAGFNVDKFGEELVEKEGKEILDKIAKKNFSNTQRILKTLIY